MYPSNLGHVNPPPGITEVLMAQGPNGPPPVTPPPPTVPLPSLPPESDAGSVASSEVEPNINTNMNSNDGFSVDDPNVYDPDKSIYAVKLSQGYDGTYSVQTPSLETRDADQWTFMSMSLETGATNYDFLDNKVNKFVNTLPHPIEEIKSIAN